PANRSKRSGKSNSVSVSFTKVQNRLSRSLRFSLVSRAEKLTVCSFLVLISRTRGQLSRTQRVSCLTSCCRLPIVRRDRRRSVVSPEFRRPRLWAFRVLQGETREQWHHHR